MNLSNSDREFFENLNRDLAKSLESAISGARPSGGGGDGGGGSDGKTKGFVDKLSASFKGALGAGLKQTVGLGFNVAAGALERSTKNALSMGDILARSTAATNRTQLLTSKTVDAQGRVITALPQISDTFRKFGISTAQAARTLDDAIRANIKNTGATAQKFLATSQGLGNSLATTNQFLATQTNVLGRSTEASTEFGDSIIGLASSNGLLADSILEAVNAFTKTTREQTAIFGSQSAQIVARAVAGAEALAPGAGTAELIRALTAPENILKLPSIAGRLGISPITATQLRDPAEMQRFLSEAIPALARFGEQEILGQAAETGLPLSQQLAAQFGEAFNLMNLQTASLMMQELGEKGQGIGSLFEATKLSTEELDNAQKHITGTSLEAATNMATFNAELALAPSYFDALRTTSNILVSSIPSAQEIRDKYGEAFDAFASVDLPLRMLGTNALAAGDGLSKLLIGLGGGVLLGSGRRGVRAAGSALTAGGRAQTRAATARVGRVAGMSDEAVSAAVKGLDDATLRSLGYTRNASGRVIDAATKQFPTNRALLEAAEAAGTAGRLSPALAGAGRILGKVAVPIGAAMPIIDEAMAEDGDLTRGVARSGGGILGGMAAGGALGLAGANPFTVGAGMIIGAIVGEEGVRAGYDYFFGDDEEKQEQAAIQQDQHIESLSVQELQLNELIGLRTDILDGLILRDPSNPFGSARSYIPLEQQTGLTNR